MISLINIFFIKLTIFIIFIMFIKYIKIYLNFSKKNLIISIISFIFNNFIFNFSLVFLQPQVSALIALSSTLFLNFYLYFKFKILQINFYNFVKLLFTSMIFRALEFTLFVFLIGKYIDMHIYFIYALSIMIVYLFKNTFVFFLFKKV